MNQDDDRLEPSANRESISSGGDAGLYCELPEPLTYHETFPSPAFMEPDSINVFVERRKLKDVPNGKILLVGLQKSGNTWLQSLLADTLDYPYLFSLEDMSGRGVLSTHIPFCDEIKYRHDFVHAVCIVRDLRDVVLSYFEYMNSVGYESEIPYALYRDIETFYYDWFLARLTPAHRFHTFTEEYAERGVPIVRYERLVKDTEGELVRLFGRWNEPVDSARIKAAVEANELARLKSAGKQMGRVTMHPSHFNKGQVGRYKEELPAPIIRDIEYRFGSVLTRWGYVTTNRSYLAMRPNQPPVSAQHAMPDEVKLARNPRANAEKSVRAGGADPADIGQLLDFFGHARDVESVLKAVGVDPSIATVVADALQENSAEVRMIVPPADRIELLGRLMQIVLARGPSATTTAAVELLAQIAQRIGDPPEALRIEFLRRLMRIVPANGTSVTATAVLDVLERIVRAIGDPPRPGRIRVAARLMQTAEIIRGAVVRVNGRAK